MKHEPTADMTYEPRQQFLMQPGEEYLGYASINTYGEINFRPKVKNENTDKEGAETLKRSDGVTICQTKKTYLIHITIAKDMLTFSSISQKMLLASQLLTRYIKRKR